MKTLWNSPSVLAFGFLVALYIAAGPMAVLVACALFAGFVFWVMGAPT